MNEIQNTIDSLRCRSHGWNKDWTKTKDGGMTELDELATKFQDVVDQLFEVITQEEEEEEQITEEYAQDFEILHSLRRKVARNTTKTTSGTHKNMGAKVRLSPIDLNRNEMNDKMTRSVKSALDGLIKSSPKNYPSEIVNSPPQKNLSGLSENSVIEDITYTSTLTESGSRLSNVSDSSLEEMSDQKISSSHRKGLNTSYARVTPPDEFSDSVTRDDWGRKSSRNSGVSLSSLSFCSQASDTTLADEEIMRTNLEIIGVEKSTPRVNKHRFARSQSVFDERNKMFVAKSFDTHFSSSDENEVLPTINDLQSKKSVSNHPYPKPVPSRFPRSQSVMDGRCEGEGDHVSSPEGTKNRKAKMSGDSAYSSLNRRLPRSGIQSSQQEDRPSSNG